MMVNADCKIQNKIKSFACGQTSNVGRVLHMVKFNAKHIIYSTEIYIYPRVFLVQFVDMYA